MPLLDDVKMRLEIPPADTTHDVLLLDLIEETLRQADSYMGLAYSKITGATEYFDGAAQRELWLAHANVSNVTVRVDGQTVPQSEYVVDAGRGIVRRRHGVWGGGVRSIAVTYDGGYDEDALPTDLRGKLIKQICYEFRRRRDPGLSSVSYPDGSVNKFATDEWLPDVLRVLARNGRIRV